jgi:type VI secretion system protein ImpL
LTGQVFQDGKVIPTRLANLWFARKVILFEVGGKLLGDTRLWSRLLRRISPARFRSIFGGAPAVPRVAVVCVDAEKFVKASNPDELMTSARAIRARLEQVASGLGISLPVYVIFTHTDRVPFFEDYFKNLATDESTQVLGATLPVFAAAGTGVYQEQESKRLSGMLTSIFHSLSECRPGMLFREHASDPLSAMKRTPLVTQFLVDLCRPSQLSTGAFRRGFYFTGVRLVESQSPGSERRPTALRPLVTVTVDSPDTPASQLRACEFKTEHCIGRSLLLVANTFLTCPIWCSGPLTDWMST